MALPTVYSVSQLVEKLPLSRNMIYALLESGVLVGTKVGAKWIVTEPNVLAWLRTDETPGAGTEGNVINLGDFTSVEVKT